MISAADARKLWDEKDESDEWIQRIDIEIRARAENGGKSIRVEYNYNTNKLTKDKIKETLIANGYYVEEFHSSCYCDNDGIIIKWEEK